MNKNILQTTIATVLILSITGCAKLDQIKQNAGFYDSKLVSAKSAKTDKENVYQIRVEVTPDTLVSTAKNKNQNEALKYASKLALEKGYTGFTIVSPVELKNQNITSYKDFKDKCQTTMAVINDGPKCGQFIYNYDKYGRVVLISEDHTNSFSNLTIKLSNEQTKQETFFNANTLLKDIKLEN